MDDRTPRIPDSEPAELPGTPMPDPHRGEPVPPAQEGLRPEAEENLVRPADDEPLGPLGELIPAAGAEAKDEATPDGDPEAESLLAQMGVEEEGIESGQILGLVLAVVVAIVALIVVVIYLFVVPLQTQVDVDAEDVTEYPELRQVRVEGLAKLDQYGRADSTYAVPIERAMGLVAAQYGAGGIARAAAVPTTRQRWNTLPISVGPPRAVQVPTSRGALTAPVPETGVETAPLNPTGVPGTVQEAERAPFPVPLQTDEEVGVDDSIE